MIMDKNAIRALLTSDMPAEERICATLAALSGEGAVTLRAGQGMKVKPGSVEFLRGILNAGPLPRQHVLKAATVRGFSEDHMTVAAGWLRVKSTRYESNRVLWSIPEASQ
ncbi:hypothetical protein [Nocardia seriolae]|uniref:Uncharacterized protein n=1 Tax=Nocardia seriolae TaxID=37332 RepID=A0A0B8NCT6_9NOCA|nr:hypothetical protein [Nocardia seriolae]APA94946.1 hypothetical protein NS506_00871 [Nocardia seriolae]MTJ60236.1 hypothetical protein [Nocardia seriolae]MTJ72594.1 hypothetical protein [Nocardia seriolae]MTJ85231.1 hypothetical protein [Nocardia seriolae]MTK29227.1 hypothetical protein [Nocardia seriolae]